MFLFVVLIMLCVLSACGGNFVTYKAESFEVYNKHILGDHISYKADDGSESADKLQIKFDLGVDFDNEKVKFTSGSKTYEGSMSCDMYQNVAEGKDSVCRCIVRFSEDFEMFYTIYLDSFKANTYTSYDPVELVFDAKSESDIKNLNEFKLVLGDFNTVRAEIKFKK